MDELLNLSKKSIVIDQYETVKEILSKYVGISKIPSIIIVI